MVPRASGAAHDFPAFFGWFFVAVGLTCVCLGLALATGARSYFRQTASTLFPSGSRRKAA